MTMEEGIVVEWRADVGDPVEAGEVVAVIESEKTTNDVEAREDGTVVERFVDEEVPVEPGHPIAYVGDDGESVPDEVRAELAGDSSSDATDDGSEPATATTTVETSRDGRRKVSPRARSYAAENDVSLAGIEGTGPEGAVIERDVIAAAEGRTGREEAPAAEVAPTGEVVGRGIYEERARSGMRRTVAERMTASAREAPQVTLNRRIPVDDVFEVKDRLATDRDVDVSLTDFIVAAVVDAVEEYPEFNAVYEDGVHKLAANVNVGVAVDVENGLVTPVIRGANRLTLEEIDRERTRLVSRVLEGEYTGDDFADGTFTISNLGHFDIDSFDPILNPPEVAILGVGSVRTELDPESLEPVRTLGLSLTFDHRAVDGADASRFLGAIADALSRPLGLVNLGERADSTGSFREVAGGATEERVATASLDEGMQATVRSRRFEWDVDEPPKHGGEDTAPSPVEQFLGSLSSCLTLMISNVADRRDVPLEDVDVTTRASPEEGRIERIDVEVTVVSEADEQMVSRVVQTAERACFVNQVVDDDLERSLEVTVTAPDRERG